MGHFSCPNTLIITDFQRKVNIFKWQYIQNLYIIQLKIVNIVQNYILQRVQLCAII